MVDRKPIVMLPDGMLQCMACENTYHEPKIIHVDEAASYRDHGDENDCVHDSDCAVHNEPATPQGPCDCGFDKVRMRIKVLPHARGLDIPAHQTAGAAGMDVRAALSGRGEQVMIPRGTWKVIPCGICIECPDGYHIAMRGRSGHAFRWGMRIVHGVGTIDADYRGELMVPLFNDGQADFVVCHGDRIAQMVLIPTPQMVLEVVDELSDTVRGEGGGGSTGRK